MLGLPYYSCSTFNVIPPHQLGCSVLMLPVRGHQRAYVCTCRCEQHTDIPDHFPLPSSYSCSPRGDTTFEQRLRFPAVWGEGAGLVSLAGLEITRRLYPRGG